MKISQLFQKHDFYGSLIEGIRHIDGSNKIVLEVELCNWKQSGYCKSDSEFVMGRIISHERLKLILLGNGGVKILEIVGLHARWENITS